MKYWTLLISMLLILKLVTAVVYRKDRIFDFLAAEVVLDAVNVVATHILAAAVGKEANLYFVPMMFIFNAVILFILPDGKVYLKAFVAVTGGLCILFEVERIGLIVLAGYLAGYFILNFRRKGIYPFLAVVWTVTLARQFFYLFDSPYKVQVYTTNFVVDYMAYLGAISYAYYTGMATEKPLPDRIGLSSGPEERPSWIKDLNERELEVLCWLAEDYTSAQIAEEMYVSKRTVDYYRSSLKKKLQLSSPQELIFLAKEHKELLQHILNSIALDDKNDDNRGSNVKLVAL